jgi:protein-disulfide isomerase
MIVDGAILIAAGLAWWRVRLTPPDGTGAPEAGARGTGAPEAGALRVLWAAAALVVALLPGFWQTPSATAVEVPPEVAAWRVEGRVNLIVFTDFQCPFCRKLHLVIEELARSAGPRLAVTRIMTPLPNHPGAEPAARAYLCAAKRQRDALCDKLYTAEPATLTPSGVASIAAGLGIPREPFEACLSAQATSAELARHQNLARKANIGGLPATFVEGFFVPGADAGKLRDAVDRALSGKDASNDVAWLLSLLASVLGAATAASLVASKRNA